MKQLVLNIPDSRFGFFMEVLRNFSFVQVDKKTDKKTLQEIENTLSPSKRKIWEDVKHGLNEVRQIEQGTLKGKPLKELLDEL